MPPAHAPKYTGSGLRVGDWRITVEYSEATDAITLTDTRSHGHRGQEQTSHRTFPFQDVEGVVLSLGNLVRMRGARRLF